MTIKVWVIHAKWNVRHYKAAQTARPSDEENTALSYNSQRVPSPIFETDATISTHMDESNFGKKRKNKRKKSNKIKRDAWKTRWSRRSPFTSHQISSYVPPIPAPTRLVLKFLLVKVLDPLLLSPVMDNVYHGHDKLFPHKWFCHGLLLAVMWDSACRLKQP